MYAVLTRQGGETTIQELDDTGAVRGAARVVDDLPAEVRRLAPDRPRWVWSDTAVWYPPLLRAGVRVERCVDVRLSHAIIRRSRLTSSSPVATAPEGVWDETVRDIPVAAEGLFALDDLEHVPRRGASQRGELDTLEEFLRQRDAVATSSEPARLGLLLAAESAGALVAAEIHHVGLPWSVEVHDRLLVENLGSRPAREGDRPSAMHAVAADVRAALDAPGLNVDSPVDLLAALGRVGITAGSTRSWELEKLTHPAIGPILEYKRLARLWTASGWAWLDTNVVDGRFHPEYVPGGVVTGRWSSKGGGGALQLPKAVRSAVVADPGWTLVVADAAQLEPRILAALASDRGMVEAGSSGDLYAGIVASGAVASREHAKVAMLGAMYGATSGDAGRLLPRLAERYPRAIGFVEAAARAGERGEVVSTHLGRTSPPGDGVGYDETATPADAERARSRAKAWGRFTRNFVVQGTAAEWALCWMAGLRTRLRALGGDTDLEREPHLAFFLHDEVVVHCPRDLADEVERAIREAAADAGRLLFGDLPVTFPVTVAAVDDYAKAK
ncbi:bifunctional 3'-5' exonuclease/DNA polymerase [Marisediminicola sp. LYQ134]|uniref:bifunctional 3'-5' exonuclease/DNA polymerase n=1 Tax=Marisediminicola sp. LYQ134 TaxID=3391061 RepID=UPI0039832856